MGMRTRPHHPILIAAIAMTGLVPGSLALANEVAGSAHVNGIQIHDATETLEQFCATDANGVLWLQVPGGGRFELIRSTSDPAVSNPGDGAFHPFDAGEVREALAEIRFPLDGLDADIFILPYPRRAELSSAAGPGLILLSPGVTPLSREHQHAELAHELGHVVQYQWFPDSDPRWSQYREDRGIENVALFNAGAPHADRPHEIFAEDFRSLFGGSLANYSGSIENAQLEAPAAVSGLPGFFLSLTTDDPAHGLRVIGANPARGAVQLSMAGSAPAPLDLFDVSGRRLASLMPLSLGNEVQWSWNGTDQRGRAVGPCLVLARVRGSAATQRFAWLR